MRRRKRHGAPCRHCGRTDTRWRRRGLCWKCHGIRAIRHRYGLRHKGGPAIGTGRDFLIAPYEAPGPLPATPGSPRRVAELVARYERRQELFDGEPPVVGIQEVSTRVASLGNALKFLRAIRLLPA